MKNIIIYIKSLNLKIGEYRDYVRDNASGLIYHIYCRSTALSCAYKVLYHQDTSAFMEQLGDKILDPNERLFEYIGQQCFMRNPCSGCTAYYIDILSPDSIINNIDHVVDYSHQMVIMGYQQPVATVNRILDARCKYGGIIPR